MTTRCYRGALAAACAVWCAVPTAATAEPQIYTIAGIPTPPAVNLFDRPRPPRVGSPATESDFGTIRGIAALNDGAFAIAGTSDVSVVGADGRVQSNWPLVAVAIAAGADGTLFAVEGNDASPFTTSGNRVVRITADGTITPIAGTEVRGFAGDGGPATQARLNSASGLALASDGSLLIADTGNARIRRVASDGTIATVAGTGAQSSGGDGGPATATALDHPHEIAALPGGGYLVVEGPPAARRVRKVAPDGAVTTAAALGYVRGLAVTSDGGFVIGSSPGLRKVGSDGVITALAGGGPTAGLQALADLFGDGEPALGAGLAPTALAAAGDDILVADDHDECQHVWTPAFCWHGQFVRLVSEHTPRLAIAALAFAGRAGRNAYRLSYSVTSAAHVKAKLFKPPATRAVATRDRNSRAGRGNINLGGRFRPGVYELSVTATSPQGAIATDRVQLILGGKLVPDTVREFALTAFDLLDWDGHGGADGGRCHRFSQRRVDCIVNAENEEGGYRYVESATLRSTGLLYGSSYPGHTFRRHVPGPLAYLGPTYPPGPPIY